MSTTKSQSFQHVIQGNLPTLPQGETPYSLGDILAHWKNTQNTQNQVQRRMDQSNENMPITTSSQPQHAIREVGPTKSTPTRVRDGVTTRPRNDHKRNLDQFLGTQRPPRPPSQAATRLGSKLQQENKAILHQDDPNMIAKEVTPRTTHGYENQSPCSTTPIVQPTNNEDAMIKEKMLQWRTQALKAYLHCAACQEPSDKCPYCSRCKKYIIHSIQCNNNACPNLCARFRLMVAKFLSDVAMKCKDEKCNDDLSVRFKWLVTHCIVCREKRSCLICGPALRFKKEAIDRASLGPPISITQNETGDGEIIGKWERVDGEVEVGVVDCSSKLLSGHRSVLGAWKDELAGHGNDQNGGGKDMIQVDEKMDIDKALHSSTLPGEAGVRERKEVKVEYLTFTGHLTVEHMQQHILSVKECVVKDKEKMRSFQKKREEHLCNLCGVDSLMFELPPKCCSNCDALIKPNAKYYQKPSSLLQYLCNRCYGSILTKAEQVEMKKLKHNEAFEEPWVQCCECKAWQHQICCLFNKKKNVDEQAEYVCLTCNMKKIEKGERMTLPECCMLISAQHLPTCRLSDYLQNRLSSRLIEERHERAKNSGMQIEEVPTAVNLSIKVVASSDNIVEVPERLRKILTNKFPSEFPYRSKAIALFQKIEGVDVLLFAMYVQEYGSKCPTPNQRHVCLSYIDSVKYFRPNIKATTGEALRTFVYHEILIGYLDYVKKRGFTSCYIWASPPTKGDSYILYCHPDIQKTPNADGLSQWYQTMLKKAAEEHIVEGVTNFFDQYFWSDNKSKAKITLARLPFFDGDYFSRVIDYTIQDIEKHNQDAQQQKTLQNKFSRAIKAARSCGHSRDQHPTDILVMQNVGQRIEKNKKIYILAHLQPICSLCSDYIMGGQRWKCSHCRSNICNICYEENIKASPRETQCSEKSDKHNFSMVQTKDACSDTADSDENIHSEIFDSRHKYLDFCKNNNYQFDSLRRAKHSTMMSLYEMLNPTTS